MTGGLLVTVHAKLLSNIVPFQYTLQKLHILTQASSSKLMNVRNFLLAQIPGGKFL